MHLPLRMNVHSEGFPDRWDMLPFFGEKCGTEAICTPTNLVNLSVMFPWMRSCHIHPVSLGSWPCWTFGHEDVNIAQNIFKNLSLKVGVCIQDPAVNRKDQWMFHTKWKDVRWLFPIIIKKRLIVEGCLSWIPIVHTGIEEEEGSRLGCVSGHKNTLWKFS